MEGEEGGGETLRVWLSWGGREGKVVRVEGCLLNACSILGGMPYD